MSKDAATHWIAQLDAALGGAHSIETLLGTQAEPLTEWLGKLDAKAFAATQGALIEACIAMARADRNLQPSELERLNALIGGCGLPEVQRRELTAELRTDVRTDALGARLGHPALAEVALALVWQLALVDGQIDPAERARYGVLAAQLGIVPERARALREALKAR